VDLKRYYLDFNATSPLSQSVLDWLKSGEVLFANPSSQHSSGKASRKLINETRAQIYSVFGLNEKDTQLFFHSGATEGMMTFAHSFSEWARLTGKELLVCYSKIDHPAVTSLSERYFGPHVKFLELQITQNLEYNHTENLKVIQDKKDNNPELLILYHHLWVHNETGIVSPLNDLKPFKLIPDLYIHVDAVQAPGKVLDWRNLDVGDIFSFSAHKIGALKGIGFSFFAKNIAFHSLISGGGQQGDLRSGTENPLSVKTIDLALKDLTQIDLELNYRLREKLEKFLVSELKDVGGIISSLGKNRNSNTIYFYFNQHPSDVTVALFDLNELQISAGSACSSGTAKASNIMTHLGYKDQAKNGLRLSLPFIFSEAELQELQEKLSFIISKLK
jgi:cysteine desulfurase